MTYEVLDFVQGKLCGLISTYPTVDDALRAAKSSLLVTNTSVDMCWIREKGRVMPLANVERHSLWPNKCVAYFHGNLDF